MRWQSIVLGTASFLASHAVVFRKWGAWFGGEHDAWFLNNGTAAVGFTALCLALAALVAAVLWARNQADSIVHGVNVAGGALVAMIAVLALVGPGTIFPIAIALGGLIAFVSTLAGALAAAAFKPRVTRST
jgi:multisubunit Na+/H+ antiporter MnhF subunit